VSAVATALPGLLYRVRSRVALRLSRGRWPVESTFLFLTVFIAYMALADYLVIHLHYMNGDALSRVANADYVIASRDPHLGAIGFIWPPLPSFLDIPILTLQRWFPFLSTQGFAGSIEAALFGAGTVVLLNLGLRRAGVLLPVRWLVLVAWVANPMTAIYSVIGMSEGPFVFFIVASLFAFMRWADEQRPAQLALLAVLVGLGTLVRTEMVFLAFIMGIGVVYCSLGRKVSWRELETRALLYGLPVLLILGLWIGSMWVIEHDPLFFAHSTYGNASQVAVAGGFGASQYGNFQSLKVAVDFVGQRSLLLFPAVLVLMGAVGLRALLARERRPAIVMLVLAAPVPLVDVYLLHEHQLALVLRYQIFVIPYAVMLGVFLLNELKKASPRVVSFAALLFAVLIGISNISSFDLLSNPTQAPEESVALVAAEHNVSTGLVRDGVLDEYEIGSALSSAVAAADKDHGLIAMDTFVGYRIWITAADRSLYVVTSDEDFQAIVAQPQAYHIEYFLVPEPTNEGSLDYINQRCPSLWATGAGFTTEVADIGGPQKWKLYKVIGTGGCI
jgi:hypothetical protein